MFGGRLNRLTASLIRRIRAKFLAQITGGAFMMGRIPRPDLKKRFLCTICEAGTCELIVENYDKAPTFCPFDKEFGSYKWEEIPEGAKNTEQQVQPDTTK